jgi:hypothetical protein
LKEPAQPRVRAAGRRRPAGAVDASAPKAPLAVKPEPIFERFRSALVDHPWRLKKDETYLFDWIAAMLRELRHPHPRLAINTG